MLALIQLVTSAEVTIDGKVTASIRRGILALLGFEKTDTKEEAEKLFDRIINYRIFPDAEGKMNLSLKNIDAEILLVPQFTLVAETNKGTRPGFSIGMAPNEGKDLFDYFVQSAKKNYAHVASGQFGAYMQVSLCNDGPVTFILQTKNKIV